MSAEVFDFNEHRECVPLFDIRVYRHPSGELVAGPLQAFEAWFTETEGKTNVERMLAIADLAPSIEAYIRKDAAELRLEGQESE